MFLSLCNYVIIYNDVFVVCNYGYGNFFFGIGNGEVKNILVMFV